MLRSETLKPKLKLLPRTGICFLGFLAAFLAAPSWASGQSFTLQLAPFPFPAAIDPGGASAANISVVAGTGFTGTVTLACQVSTNVVVTGTIPPTCAVSPPSVAAAGSASVTVTSVGTGATATTPGQYTITVTGTSGGSPQSQATTLTVLSVSPQFTITVTTVIQPTSVPAGSGGQGIVSINPINGYISPKDPNNSANFGVTLSCASITPLVTLPPICSFNPPHPPVTGNASATSTLIITTYGPVVTGAAARRRSVYGFGLWLPLPLLAFAGLGAAAGGKRARKAWGLLALLVLSGSILLMPACGNTPATTTPNGITPANTYTFAVLGVDLEGNVSSNTSSTGASPTVSLTVTAPTPQ